MEHTADIKLPPAFSGEPQFVLYTRYGDPREAGWENKWLTKWHVHTLHPWFPVEEIKIHKHFWTMLSDAFTDLEKEGLHLEIKSFSGCHRVEHIHNSPVLSVHSWGAGIDLNIEDNPIGTAGSWSDEFIRVMTAHGIFCGQNWTGSKEPMHFSMVNGD